MCEIKAITTSHLTENAISLDKTFRLQKYQRGHILPLWWPTSHKGNSNKMQLHVCWVVSTDRHSGRAEGGVCASVRISDGLSCTQTRLWVSIFIRCEEENPIMIVSVEIKETDLYWLQAEQRCVLVCVSVCFCVCLCWASCRFHNVTYYKLWVALIDSNTWLYYIIVCLE